MVRFTGGLLLFSALALAAPPDHSRSSGEAQRVLSTPSQQQEGNPRKLRGRFLHITDVHPDPFYKAGTDPDGAHPCHKGKGEKTAGYYGAAVTDCDTPFSLVNATFKWIEENVKDEIDFVVWTGDSARHDNDEDIPRSNKQVEDLNKFVVHKFVETFGKADNINDPDPTNDFVVPIVPTYGNNDILPHNIFEPGPNRWTRTYEEIWNKFVPEAQRHSFARGGWFFTEVIPRKLAVISLNTLYFFDSNSAVDGCDLKSEPGYEHMEWLRIQLQFLRERGMKAILIGHVPPARTDSKQSWDESCYQKYTLWQRQYRDVIVGNIYGHMNIDHFMFQDVRDLNYKFKIKGIDDEGLRPKMYDPTPMPNDQFHAYAKTTYLNELRAGWSDLPKPPKGESYLSTLDQQNTSGKADKKKDKQRDRFLKDIGGPWGERFSISVVSPSVVPNYFPTIRIIEYNITGLENDHPAIGYPQGAPATEDDLRLKLDDDDQEDNEDNMTQTDDTNSGSEDEEDASLSTQKKKKHKKKKKKPTRPDFVVPAPPSPASPPGPAYSPQTLSLLSWTQLYANITKIHEAMASDSTSDTNSKSKPKDHFKYKLEYTTHNDSVYRMSDLTVRSWLDIAERIGRTEYKGKIEGEEITAFDSEDASSSLDESTVRTWKGDHKLRDNHLWHTFIKRAFVEARLDSELEPDFG